MKYIAELYIQEAHEKKNTNFDMHFLYNIAEIALDGFTM